VERCYGGGGRDVFLEKGGRHEMWVYRSAEFPVDVGISCGWGEGGGVSGVSWLLSISLRGW